MCSWICSLSRGGSSGEGTSSDHRLFSLHEECKRRLLLHLTDDGQVHIYSSNGSSGSFAGDPCLQHSRCRHEADSARVHLLIYLQVMRANPADPPCGAHPADGAAPRLAADPPPATPRSCGRRCARTRPARSTCGIKCLL